MQVAFRFFKGTLKSWEKLFQEAADFAGTLGPEQLISISHSCDQGEGVVTVWYWDIESDGFHRTGGERRAGERA